MASDTHTDNTLSEQEMRMLGNIFRLILKEISTKSDIDTLAPGEMGINYHTGGLYVRNPHNGKIFSPNMMEFARVMAKKLEPGTDALVADKINGITFYKELSDLDPIPGISFTPDSVIRQMGYPAIFLGKVNYDNYEALGWPCRSSMCSVYKFSPDTVNIRLFDTENYVSYDGRYNSGTLQFEGWVSASVGTTYNAVSISGGSSLRFDLLDDPDDLTTVTVHLDHDLSPEFAVSVNGSDPMPVICGNGNPPETGIPKNSSIMLMYDKDARRWILFDDLDSPTSMPISLMSLRVKDICEDFKRESARLVSDMEISVKNEIDRVLERVSGYEQDLRRSLTEAMEHVGQAVSELDAAINANRELILTRPGNIKAIPYVYTAAGDGIEEVLLPDDFDDNDKLIVNYGQTILQVGISYDIEGNLIKFKGFSLYEGDVVQFIILKQD